ncbi:MAG: hypothetical protein GYB66_11100 [Chloroflexi bacterium]|nr:hypothetical protein [Chloroflexota bacterium]
MGEEPNGVESPKEEVEATATTDAQSSRFRIPIWVLVVGMIFALVLAGFVVLQVVEPLADLLLDSGSDVPVPDGASLERERDDVGSASKEWLYATEQTGCDVAKFYADQGANCTFAPYACGLENEQTAYDSMFHVATCIKSEKNSVGGYSWRVDISSGFQTGKPTRFSIALYD